ncbi:unnamed protein product [Polarella glacialis]|uniref:Uncharacterized protein n=1 Tax=Polarella glacialis TaxID=89957 RepID=A0A813GMI5_POLGL|nr:unnamed protein product [Polarella glacialis]
MVPSLLSSEVAAAGRACVVPTSVIRLRLPQQLINKRAVRSLDSAVQQAQMHLLLRAELEGFGPVLKATPGGDGSAEEEVEVRFFAVQSAMAAKDHFGNRCVFLSTIEPPPGLDSDFHSRMPDPPPGITQSQKLATESLPGMVRQKGQLSIPNQLNWEALASGREKRRDLLLRGLPRRLCNRVSFMQILEEAGLSVHVVKMQAVASKKVSQIGSMILRVADASSSVGKVARFFHGRQFGPRSLPVSVSFSEESTCHTACDPELKSPNSATTSPTLTYQDGSSFSFGRRTSSEFSGFDL